jgi:hypothetical protein
MVTAPAAHQPYTLAHDESQPAHPQYRAQSQSDGLRMRKSSPPSSTLVVKMRAIYVVANRWRQARVRHRPPQ